MPSQLDDALSKLKVVEQELCDKQKVGEAGGWVDINGLMSALPIFIVVKIFF